MRIKCPYCGERPLAEFSYRGDATVIRPTSVDVAATDAWNEYVYLRDNPAGPIREHWYHGVGCRAWLVVTRNTSTHEVVAVEMAAQDK